MHLLRTAIAQYGVPLQAVTNAEVLSFLRKVIPRLSMTDECRTEAKPS